MDIRSGVASSGGPDTPIDIYYEDMGDPNHPPVLLVMGLGAQLLLWRTEFCEKLVNQGLRVIRYDNRDVGLSSKLTGQRSNAGTLPSMVRSFIGRPSPAVYTLEDLADDAAALLDHLDIERAHVVGASMGGMIAQIFAARFPQRTHTLGIIFSSNNQALLPPPGYQQLRSLLQRPADSTREAIIANAVRVAKIIGSPGYPRTDEELQADVLEGYERAYYPAGIARHFAAVLGSGSLLALRPSDHRADGGHPRQGRQADAAFGRPGDRPRHQGRAAGSDRRHGPRPARRAVGPDRRRAEDELRRSALISADIADSVLAAKSASIPRREASVGVSMARPPAVPHDLWENAFRIQRGTFRHVR